MKKFSKKHFFGKKYSSIGERICDSVTAHFDHVDEIKIEFMSTSNYKSFPYSEWYISRVCLQTVY